MNLWAPWFLGLDLRNDANHFSSITVLRRVLEPILPTMAKGTRLGAPAKLDRERKIWKFELTELSKT